MSACVGPKLDRLLLLGEVVGILSRVELNSTPTVCKEGFLTAINPD